jgi:ubiquinone/menaquinone biosynthesis C-methylase UbiE
LITQAEVWAPMAEWLLDRIGVAAGSTVIDVACGPLGILHLLADKVGASGQVYGLDIEPRMIDLARQVAADRGVTVNFVSANAASTGLPRRAFDLVHARTLLINVVNPDELVSEMRDIAKPGGAVALQEPDAAYWVCDPPHPAWDRLLAALQTTYRLQGRDFSVGRRLGRILRDAGLESVQTHAHVFQTEAGDVYQTLLLGIIDAARPLIIEAGLYDEVGLDRLCRAARSHLERPTTTTATAMWQAWGRRSSGETAGVAAP